MQNIFYIRSSGKGRKRIQHKGSGGSEGDFFRGGVDLA
jgi:hypothetical protein